MQLASGRPQRARGHLDAESAAKNAEMEMTTNANLLNLQKLEVLRSCRSLAAGEVVTEAALSSRACCHSARHSTAPLVMTQAALSSRACPYSARHGTALPFVEMEMAPNANLPNLKGLDVLRSSRSLAAGEVVTEAALSSRACCYSARHNTALREHEESQENPTATTRLGTSSGRPTQIGPCPTGEPADACRRRQYAESDRVCRPAEPHRGRSRGRWRKQREDRYAAGPSCEAIEGAREDAKRLTPPMRKPRNGCEPLARGPFEAGPTRSCVFP